MANAIPTRYVGVAVSAPYLIWKALPLDWHRARLCVSSTPEGSPRKSAVEHYVPLSDGLLRVAVNFSAESAPRMNRSVLKRSYECPALCVGIYGGDQTSQYRIAKSCAAPSRKRLKGGTQAFRVALRADACSLSGKKEFQMERAEGDWCQSRNAPEVPPTGPHSSVSNHSPCWPLG